MSFWQELSSWNPFLSFPTTQPVPVVGSPAPRTSQLTFPRADGKPVLAIFLRHCGCPFAEKTFAAFRQIAEGNTNIHCIAISHSDQSATDKWVDAVGGRGRVEIVDDHERQVYALYGLGLSSFWHTLNPWSLSSAVKLGRQEGIWNRPTESGSRWQTSGTFAIDAQGTVKYAKVAGSADEPSDFQQALNSLT